MYVLSCVCERHKLRLLLFLLCLLFPGVLKATTYQDRCLQVTLLQTKTQGSEDCLYLNIFVPQGTQCR